MFGRISTAVALTAASLVGLPTAAWAITIHQLTGQPFSEPYTVYTGRSWPSGNYHFDFRVTTRGTGTGFGKVGW
jgi:hypothetical protein